MKPYVLILLNAVISSILASVSFSVASADPFHYSACPTCGLQNPSSFTNQARQLEIYACEDSLKAADCTTFYKQNDIPMDEQRNCKADPKTLPARGDQSVLEYGKGCGFGAAKNIFEPFEALAPIFAIRPYDQEQLQSLSFIKENIKTPDDKERFFKPFEGLHLFTHEEITGIKGDKRCKDPNFINDPSGIAKNMCEGIPAHVLYGRIVTYMTEQAEKTKLDQYWRVPWHDVPVVVKYRTQSPEATAIPLNTRVKKAIATAGQFASDVGLSTVEGFKQAGPTLLESNQTVALSMLDWFEDNNIKFTCYNNKRRWQMGCYGLAAIVTAIPEGEEKLAAEVEKLALFKNASQAVKLRKEFALKKMFSEEEELRWIEHSKQIDPDEKTIFFHIQNSKLKPINDQTADHEFADALSNKYKDIFLEKLNAIKNENENLQFSRRNDGKSLEFSITPIPPLTKVPPEVEQQIGEAFRESNREYANYLVDKGIALKSAKPEDWFRAATGGTADQASALARAAREREGENEMLRFSDPNHRALLEKSLIEFHELDSHLVEKLGGTEILESVPYSRQMEMTTEATKLVRKNPNLKDLEQALRIKYGDKAAAEAEYISAYVKVKDVFSPTPRATRAALGAVAEKSTKEVIDKAKYDVITIDLVGQSAINIKATGQVLRVSDTVEGAIRNARLQDVHVTKDLELKANKVETAISAPLPKSVTTDIGRTGDERSFAPDTPLTKNDFSRLARKLATSLEANSVRMTVVTRKVTDPVRRAQLGYFGESLEKKTRQELEKTMARKLKNVLLTPVLDGKTVQLIITDVNKPPLTDDELKLIKRTFDSSNK